MSQVKYSLFIFDQFAAKCNRFDVRQEGREIKRQTVNLCME